MLESSVVDGKRRCGAPRSQARVKTGGKGAATKKQLGGCVVKVKKSNVWKGFGMLIRSRLEAYTLFLLEALTHEHWVANSRELVPGLEVDLYCPLLGLAIEINGPWHYRHDVNLSRVSRRNHEKVKCALRKFRKRQENDARKARVLREKRITLLVIRIDAELESERIYRNPQNYIDRILRVLVKKHYLVQRDGYIINKRNQWRLHTDAEAMCLLIKRFHNKVILWLEDSGRITAEEASNRMLKKHLSALRQRAWRLPQSDLDSVELLRFRAMKIGTDLTIPVWVGYFMLHIYRLPTFNSDPGSLWHRAFTSSFCVFMASFEAFKRGTGMSMGITYIRLYKYAKMFGVSLVMSPGHVEINDESLKRARFKLPSRKCLLERVRCRIAEDCYVWRVYRPYLHTMLPDRQHFPDLPLGVSNKQALINPEIVKPIDENVGVREFYRHLHHVKADDVLQKKQQPPWIDIDKQRRLIYLIKYLR